MRKIINLVAITLLFISCNNTSKKLEMLKEGTFIYERERVLQKKNITVEQSKIEMIRETKYVVEEKVIYDSLGILQIYDGAAEGFIIHTRNKSDGNIIFKNRGYSNKILINRKLDCLIDGKDTIRNFEVFLKDRLIMVYPKEDDRIYVYKFK